MVVRDGGGGGSLRVLVGVSMVVERWGFRDNNSASQCFFMCNFKYSQT